MSGVMHTLLNARSFEENKGLETQGVSKKTRGSHKQSCEVKANIEIQRTLGDTLVVLASLQDSALQREAPFILEVGFARPNFVVHVCVTVDFAVGRNKDRQSNSHLYLILNTGT